MTMCLCKDAAGVDVSTMSDPALRVLCVECSGLRFIPLDWCDCLVYNQEHPSEMCERWEDEVIAGEAREALITTWEVIDEC